MMNDTQNRQSIVFDTTYELVKPRPFYQLFLETIDKIEQTFVKIADYLKNDSKYKKKGYFRYLKSINKVNVNKSAVRIVETAKTAAYTA